MRNARSVAAEAATDAGKKFTTLEQLMALAIRRPYEDELLATLIMQYMAEERVAYRYAFLRSILDCKTSSFALMPAGLDRLSDETRDYWCMSAQEIAQALTTMPYHVASSSPRVFGSVLAVMTGAVARIRNRGGLGFGRYAGLETLRYCRQCAFDDWESGRQPYFRRTHQLPGVAVCPKHGTLLTCSELRVSTLHSEGVGALPDAFKGGEAVAIGEAASARMQTIVGVARKSKEILLHASPSSFFDMRLDYRCRLDGLGYAYRSGNCRLDDLSADIVAYFGQPFLQWLGLYRSGQEARDWLVPLLCRGQAVAPTVAHVLLQQFIEYAEPNIRRANSRLVIQCPCDAPQHEGGIFRGGVAWRSATVGAASCLCGASFQFHLNGHVPVVDRIWRYARCYGDKATKLAEQGLDVQQVAHRLGVNVVTARRLCSGLTSRHPASARASFDVERGRQEWLDAVKRFGSLPLARRMVRRTYRALLKHDRNWLDQHRLRVTRSVVPRVDWACRDAVYLPKLERAAEAIRLERPPRWVSAISILMVADVPRGTRNQLAKLPRCRTLLKDVVETRQQFRERKTLEF